MGKAIQDFERRQREQVGKLVKAAWDGKLPWVDQAIQRVGYLRGDLKSMAACDVARLWGVTAQAVGLWHSRKGCPRNLDGTYDLGEVLRWHVTRQQEGAATAGRNLQAEKAREVAARADKCQLEVAQLAGQLVPLEWVAREWNAACAAMKSKVRSVAPVLAPQLAQAQDPKQIQRLIREKIDEALEELAAYQPLGDSEPALGLPFDAAQYGGDDPPVDDQAGPAPRPDRQPVGRRKPKAKS